MAPEHSSLCSKEFNIAPYLAQPHQSTPLPYSLQIHCTIIVPPKLCLPNGLFSWSFPTKMMKTFCSIHMHPTFAVCLTLHDLIIMVIWCEEYKLWGWNLRSCLTSDNTPHFNNEISQTLHPTCKLEDYPCTLRKTASIPLQLPCICEDQLLNPQPQEIVLGTTLRDTKQEMPVSTLFTSWAFIYTIYILQHPTKEHQHNIITQLKISALPYH